MNERNTVPEISRKTLAAQVQDMIRDAIIQRRLEPGQKIDQIRLAEELNVSLVPVREALRALEAEGLVMIVPRRGAFVTEVSKEHLDDLYAARQIIEGEVAYRAVDRLTDGDLERLRALAEAMKARTAEGDIRGFMALNREFHMTIYERAGNQHLIDIIYGLWERSELYRFRYVFVLHNAGMVHEEHSEIVKACADRDAERLRACVVAHIVHTQKGLHRELEQDGA